MAAATLQEVSAGRATQRVRSGVAVEIPALGRTVDYLCLRRVLSTIDFTVLGSVSCAFLVRAGAPDVVTVALVGRHCWRAHRYRVAIVADSDLLLAIYRRFRSRGLRNRGLRNRGLRSSRFRSSRIRDCVFGVIRGRVFGVIRNPDVLRAITFGVT